MAAHDDDNNMFTLYASQLLYGDAVLCCCSCRIAVSQELLCRSNILLLLRARIYAMRQMSAHTQKSVPFFGEPDGPPSSCMTKLE